MASFDELALQYVVLDDEVIMRDLAAQAAKGWYSVYCHLAVPPCPALLAATWLWPRALNLPRLTC